MAAQDFSQQNQKDLKRVRWESVHEDRKDSCKRVWLQPEHNVSKQEQTMPVPQTKFVECLQDICRELEFNVLGPLMHNFLFNSESCKMLGSGTYGTCYLASVSSSRWVTKSCQGSSMCVRSLVQEMRALHALQDIPGVQKIIAVCPEYLTIVTEYAGDTLETLTKKRVLSRLQTLEILSQVCNILIGIHSHGWIHLDIKANNICIKRTREGLRVTIIDYGLAVPLGHKVNFPDVAKAHHIAPEVLRNQPATAQADYFSIARLITYLEILCNCELQVWIQQALFMDVNRRPNLKVLQELLRSAINKH
ncbi:hypothetical protein OTU49_014511 [Cherax quadricarinatus]|uniref:Protein kinase domain-containing protein n=1 Tax=Cherax quadricarinatus TaxID=27406 RepID=A0AAW0VNU6_CHEQU